MNSDLKLPAIEAATFRGFPYPILLVAGNGMLQFASTAAAELLQIPEQELIARSWAGLDAQLTVIAWKTTWKQLCQSGKIRYTTDLVMGSDLLRPVSVTLIAVNDDQAIIVLEDIQHKSARKAQLDLVNQQAGIGTFRYDYLLKQWHLSAAFLDFLAWDHTGQEEVVPHQAFKKKLEATLLPESWTKLERRFLQSVQEQASFEIEILLQPELPHQRLVITALPLANALHTVQIVGTLSTVATGVGAAPTNDSLALFSLDRAQDMILWVRKAGSIAYANYSFLDHSGYTRSEVCKLSILDILVDDQESMLEKLWQQLENQKLSEGETVIKTKKGALLEVSFNVNFVQGETEEVACFYIRDITQANQRKALLELTQFTTDNAPDMVFWTRPDRSIIYANDIVYEKLQIPKDEPNSLDQVVQIVPSFDEEARDAFWQELREKKSVFSEFTLYGRNGIVVETEVNASLLNFKGEEIACSFCRDITETKRRQVRRDLLEITLDSVRDIVVWLRPDGSIPYANKQFFKKTDFKPGELSSLQGSDFFTEASWEAMTNDWDFLRSGGDWEKDVVMKLRDDKYKTYHANLHYISFQGDEYISIYLRDQSKRIRRDLELKLSYGALEAAEEVVVWLKETGEVQYLNQAMITYIGKTREYWLEQQLRRVFPQLKLEQVVPGTSMEYSMPSHEGHTVYLELTFSAIEQDNSRYLVIIGRNFTERYLRRKEITKAHRKIEDLSARLQQENVVLREEVSSGQSIDNIITVSENYQKVLQQVSQVADTDTTVLILGETGTGKELLARSVHGLSNRAEQPLIKLNCAVLPENLIESELFGHEQGAFTGAHARKRGRFELADRGTIFLDEVGELPLSLQAKLLRVLQEGEFERVGGTETLKVDVRLIAATNRSLEDMVRGGRFRADLYYRLNVFPIVNIPLRERPEDIPVLAQFFARRFAQRQGKKIEQINSTDLKALQKYRFPGNVRELENIIERAVVLCKTETLRIQLDQYSHNQDLGEQTFVTFDEMQREYIIKALKRTEGRITGPEGAGRLLGLNDRTLMSKMRKFDIEKKEYLL